MHAFATVQYSLVSSSHQASDHSLEKTSKKTILTMFTLIFIGLVTLLAVALIVLQRRKRNVNLPPGPPGLPLLGNVFQFGKTRPYKKFSEWAEEYGPVFRFKIGMFSIVVINNYKALKELFNDPASAGRNTNNVAIKEFTRGPYGVINSDGATWEAQRRFTLRTLRDFGYAKVTMESLIMEEADSMVEWFKKRLGEEISSERLFNAPVVNSLWRIVSGERCEWEDIGQGKTPEILEAAEEWFAAMVRISSSGFLNPSKLRYIMPGRVGWTQYCNSVAKMRQLFIQSVARHKESLDPNSLRDLMDHHLMEIENTTDPESSFYKETGDANLMAGVFDLFLAGSETTANTLLWALVYLSEYKQVQTKMQAEIDLVLGSSRSPSLSDRPNLPYTEAVISELLRRTAVLPLGVPHQTRSDINFRGFVIPKGMLIFANIHGMHHDPAIWGDPENFRPERFLNEDQTKYVRHESLVPFSDGRRKCIGESLAKDTLFLFIVSIFKTFNVSTNNLDLEPDKAFFHVPKAFKAVLTLRD